MSPKFKLNTEVSSRKIGVVGFARIVGMVEGRIWHNLNAENADIFSTFERNYPDWTNKMVYYVEFGTMVKPMTKEQYLIEQENGNSFCEGDYDDMCNGRIFVYPEEDLQELEW